MIPNDADGMANSVDPDQRSSLIWVCTVCPGLSVRKLRIITVHGFTCFVIYSGPCGCVPLVYVSLICDHLAVCLFACHLHMCSFCWCSGVTAFTFNAMGSLKLVWHFLDF